MRVTYGRPLCERDILEYVLGRYYSLGIIVFFRVCVCVCYAFSVCEFTLGCCNKRIWHTVLASIVLTSANVERWTVTVTVVFLLLI